MRTRKKGTGEHTCEQDTRAAKTQTQGKIKTWIELSTHLSLRRLAVVRLHSQLGPGATNLEEERWMVRGSERERERERERETERDNPCAT